MFTCIVGDKRPQLRDINNYVITKCAAKWKQLGINLKLDENLLKIIKCNHPNDCESCCSVMLSEWLDINPYASWEMLNNAIDRIENDLNENYNEEKLHNAADKLPLEVEKLCIAADNLSETIEKLDAFTDKLPDTIEKLDIAVKTVDQLHKEVNKPVDKLQITKRKKLGKCVS